VQRLRDLSPPARRRLLIVGQIAALAIIAGFVGYAIRDSWAEAQDKLVNADPLALTGAIAFVGAYYMVFVVGWTAILDRLGIPLPYTSALRAEMLSMLAKYVPGGVWTPAARIVAARRAGITDTPRVLGSIAFEAGLSAIAGVLVLFAGVLLVSDADVPYLPLVAFAVVCAVLLHPRVFAPASTFLLKRMGGGQVPPLPYRTILGLLAFYSCTWVVGGVALWLLTATVGDAPSASAIPYMGGASAVGAIVAVLVVLAPSGLGVREGSMLALLVAVMPESTAVAVVVLNRLVITLVEIALLVAAGFVLRDEPPAEERDEGARELGAPTTVA
jgi:uncharacterized membrane protein YbhN (UPF0104 family)